MIIYIYIYNLFNIHFFHMWYACNSYVWFIMRKKKKSTIYYFFCFLVFVTRCQSQLPHTSINLRLQNNGQLLTIRVFLQLSWLHLKNSQSNTKLNSALYHRYQLCQLLNFNLQLPHTYKVYGIHVPLPTVGAVDAKRVDENHMWFRIIACLALGSLIAGRYLFHKSLSNLFKLPNPFKIIVFNPHSLPASSVLVRIDPYINWPIDNDRLLQKYYRNTYLILGLGVYIFVIILTKSF